MNINYRETQYNFLENASQSSHDPHGPRVLSAQLVLSAENLVIFTIVSIMLMLFCFSLGVERGKKVALFDVKVADSVPAKAVQTAPEKEAVADEIDGTPAGEAKKDIFQAFLASFGGKGKAVSPDAQPLVDQAAIEVRPVKEAQASISREKSPKSVLAETPVAQPGTSGSYTVQVASYKSEKFAQKEAQNLKQKGYREVYVVPKGSFVIVCVGNFTTKSDASTFTHQLKSRYQDTLVRRL